MLQTVIQQRRRDLGGMQVGRVLPAPAQHMVGPFIFFDHMGPVHMPVGLPRHAVDQIDHAVLHAADIQMVNDVNKENARIVHYR